MGVKIEKIEVVGYDQIGIEFTIDSKENEEVLYTIFRALISNNLGVECSLGMNDSPFDFKGSDTVHQLIYESGGRVMHSKITKPKKRPISIKPK